MLSYDYPNDFELNLIKMHGWYNRDNNKNGVSRDHVYSVKDGYYNKINFNLLAHPANCRLMLQKDNRAKYHASTISLTKLKKNISIWDKQH